MAAACTTFIDPLAIIFDKRNATGPVFLHGRFYNASDRISKYTNASTKHN